MQKHDVPEAFGVFKPVGHVVISFKEAADQAAAADALRAAGFDDGGIVRYAPEEMAAQIRDQMGKASPLASIGQEMNLVKAHLALAEQGYSWLIVKAPGDDEARRVAEIARQHRAERAQSYGRLIIEELIEHAGDERQVAESPDRGLDSQTRSGREQDRA